jgi:hypothetical protein
MINAHSPAQLQPLNKEGELAKEGKKLDLNEELRVSPLCVLQNITSEQLRIPLVSVRRNSPLAVDAAFPFSGHLCLDKEQHLGSVGLCCEDFAVSCGRALSSALCISSFHYCINRDTNI